MPRLRALVGKGVISEAAVNKLGAKSIHSAEDLLFFTCTNFAE
jgi:hypothetical protein